MKKLLIATCSVILTLATPYQTKAENFEHLDQLLTTGKCPNCDLIDAGLVMIDLKGADLRGANLIGANLSRADLTGADLSGANLTNASFFGANLSGVNFSGANLSGTDLRNSYLQGANVKNSNIGQAYIEGAQGLSGNAATAEQFYLWAMTEDKQGNYPQAMKYYSQAIELDGELAPAYLGRAVIKSRYGDADNAVKDALLAQELFESQENSDGYLLSARFVEMVQAREAYENEQEGDKGSPALVQAATTVVPLLFQLFSPF